MDNAVFSATVSGAAAVIVATLTAESTYLLATKREREADWRKLKLDLYKGYTDALSNQLDNKTQIASLVPRPIRPRN